MEFCGDKENRLHSALISRVKDTQSHMANILSQYDLQPWALSGSLLLCVTAVSISGTQPVGHSQK